ncbi:hypothetical protein FOE78_22965 [Microlunatus elymi]|uniref:Uncharacterized protein n=1 Tax=Microlunatus elymi TaxID=2596828 RepID=A0A516Q4T6_9ACTN|nr:hypothetical protein [Microlunatus elymi]QDP98382.1 hypothetical protein FOE78_22965 [Microlunatus elymi]
MDAWLIGLIALLVVGIGVIAYGGLSDRRKHQREVTALLSPPPRTVPQLDPSARTPRYVTTLQAHRPPAAGERPQLSDDQRETIKHELRSAVTVPIGYSSEAFLTDRSTGWAVLDHPRVLVSAEPIMSVRELISIIEHMITDGDGLVIAAPSMAPDVLDTLEVNHIQRKIDLLVLLTRDPAPMDKIIETTGATLISRIDLQNGSVADRDLGHCDRWVSDRRSSHLIMNH